MIAPLIHAVVRVGRTPLVATTSAGQEACQGIVQPVVAVLVPAENQAFDQ